MYCCSFYTPVIDMCDTFLSDFPMCVFGITVFMGEVLNIRLCDLLYVYMYLHTFYRRF